MVMQGRLVGIGLGVQIWAEWLARKGYRTEPLFFPKVVWDSAVEVGWADLSNRVSSCSFLLQHCCSCLIS